MSAAGAAANIINLTMRYWTRKTSPNLSANSSLMRAAKPGVALSDGPSRLWSSALARKKVARPGAFLREQRDADAHRCGKSEREDKAAAETLAVRRGRIDEMRQQEEERGFVNERRNGGHRCERRDPRRSWRRAGGQRRQQIEDERELQWVAGGLEQRRAEGPETKQRRARQPRCGRRERCDVTINRDHRDRDQHRRNRELDHRQARYI